MTRLSFSDGLLLLGGVLTALAILWWWIVFDELLKTNTMSFAQIVPCLASESDLCSLAQSICREDHFLGIRKYFAEAFWISATFFGVAVILRLLPSGREA